MSTTTIGFGRMIQLSEPEPLPPITRFGQGWHPLEVMARLRARARGVVLRPAFWYGSWTSVRFIESGPVERMPEGACLNPHPEEWRHLEAGAWEGWRNGESNGGNPMRHYQPEGGNRLNAHISWGRTADHVRPGDWGPGALWYADLEVDDAAMHGPSSDTRALRHDRFSNLAGHIERGYPTLELALGAVAWLRSCVEVCGEAGLLALNKRSGGRHA